MPNNWKKYKLGEIAKLRKKNITPKDFDNQHYIGLEHIGQGTFLLDGIGTASDATSNKSVFKSGDILYGKIRPYFKKVYRPKFSGICSTDILVINSRDEELITQSYLHQLIKSQDFTDKATETSSGTKMPRADWNSLEKLEYNLPPLPEQKSIASILSTIDDKIENNLAINKTLEEMAMALYKHWFVDFGPFQEGEFVESELGRIPEGWEVIQFSKIVSKYIDNRGKTPPIEEEGIPLLEVKHISSNLFPDLKVQKYVSENTYNNWFRNHLEEDDIIISTVGTVGLTSLVPTFSKVAIAQNLLGLRFEKNKFPTGFMFYLMKSPYFLNQIENRLVITVQKSIKRSDLDKIPCLIPNQNLINSFNEIATGYIKQIENNLTENQTLTQLRDTLLPKLISGEVRLKEFRESITN